MPIRLSEGNSKLNSPNGGVYRILGFGIPADSIIPEGNTCPGAKACRKPCYAKQGRYLMPNVMAARIANLEASRTDTFVDDMVKNLKKRRVYNVVRIHDSGDFYNQEYYNKWCDIARRMEGSVIFYAYTKCLHLDLYTNKPNNLKIIQSLGGKYDSLVNKAQPHSRIFSDNFSRIAAGYCDGNTNDVPAIEGATHIGLVYHGNRKLTAAEYKFFS